MLSYIIQVLFFQLLFLMVYELLLKKETFFDYNRLYLLITPVLALILPFLSIEELYELLPKDSAAVINSIRLPEVVIGNPSQTIERLSEVHVSSNKVSINWWMLAYALGVLLSLGIVFKKYLNLRKLFNFKIITKSDSYSIIEIPSSNLACTFYRTIFLGDQLSRAEKQQIMAHELVHVKGKHSLDLLFFEVLKIAFWFNPLIYIFQNKLAIVHEYIADANVVETTSKGSYYEQLLNSAFNTQNISFINQFFNHSLIKKRIVMLQKSKSKNIAKIKYLAILPLLAIMLTIVSCSTKDQSTSEINDVSISTQLDNLTQSVQAKGELSEEEMAKFKELVAITLEGSNKSNNKSASYGSDVPFALIEQVPLFPGCEELSSNEEQKKCMSSKIQEHIMKNFNSEAGKGLTGVNRVIVQFKINKEGKIENVKARAASPELEKEGIRVVESLPQMVPGKQDGQEVGVMYSLPIVFQVD